MPKVMGFYPGAWVCPRCKRMNAPHATQCNCGPADEVMNNWSGGCRGQHEWEPDTLGKTTAAAICRRCGETKS